MFGKFVVTPSITPDVTGVSVRAKISDTVVGTASGLKLSGTAIEDSTNTDGDVDGIGNGSAVPESTGVKKLQPTLKWEFSLNGAAWTRAADSGPIKMYFTNATPLGDDAGDLFDFALEKACGYVSGDADIAGKINAGLDGDVYYSPFGCTSHHLYLLSTWGYGQCCCHAHVFRILVRSVDSVSPYVTYIWGGCSWDVVCTYIFGTWANGPSFRVVKDAHDGAANNPHFLYHVEAGLSGTYYDPSYGETGLIAPDEFAPATQAHPTAASRRTDGSLPGNEHEVNWTCNH